MSRSLKKQISLWLPRDLVDLLDVYLYESGGVTSRREFIEEAIVDKLKKDGVL